VEYKLGQKCAAMPDMLYSVSFQLECDPTATDVSTAFSSVYFGTCHNQFNFKSKEACPVYIPPRPSNEGANSHTV
jgi:hypothetical protein